MADTTSPTTPVFFLSNIDHLRDPVRNTRWRVLVPNTIWTAVNASNLITNGENFVNEGGEDEFALHVKTCTIPNITVTHAAHNYMGFPSAYPVNATIAADFPFSTILLEDMRAYEAVFHWLQACINTNLLVDESKQGRTVQEIGLATGLGNHKDAESSTAAVLRNSSIKVELYNWMRGDVILRVTLINAFPTGVNGYPLTYAPDAAIVNFDFTLHCDRWTIEFPKDYTVGP
jgi:hypothetical protein